jgi:RES domain
MLEVRPWLGSSVSVARFKPSKDLRVVDCSQGSAGVELWPRYFQGEPEPGERERSVWTSIDLAFAEPFDRSDDVADYAPTQITAELFKREGYDGVKYRSALSETGHNVALFDITSAQPDSCDLFHPTKVSFKFKEHSPLARAVRRSASRPISSSRACAQLFSDARSTFMHQDGKSRHNRCALMSSHSRQIDELTSDSSCHQSEEATTASATRDYDREDVT